MNITFIAAQFQTDITQVQPLGCGLINDTYLVSSKTQSFVLQRLNQQVFKNPLAILENLQLLNTFIASQAASSLALQIPLLLKARTGAFYYQDAQHQYWRAITYIKNSYSLLKIENVQQASQIGFALGQFHRLCNQLPVNSLQCTLANFHITPFYLKQYLTICEQLPPLPCNKASRYCADFIDQIAPLAQELEQAKSQGLLPLRVIHGDPKADNFLFSSKTKQVISLIDLDTVQAGLVHYDIGDCIRSCCQDINGGFNINYCRAILASYLQEAKYFFTPRDYDFLYSAIRLLPFELGLRFYSDYLQGNCYFKVDYPEQNLERAVQQFQCCATIMANEALIKTLITDLISAYS